jgi:predicted ATPase/GAF domain-containing protein/tRNA A-37 threonylcarbamoyl transferase component Bud32
MLGLPHHIFTEALHAGSETALYRGRRHEDGRPVVAKTAREEHPSRYVLAKLRHEYAVLQDLQGVPGVTKVYGLEPNGDNLVLLLEDPRALPLSDVLNGQRPNLATVLRIAIALAGTLEGIHRRRIIHKDIKPQNILVDISKETPAVYLIDYGIAARLSQENQRAGDPGTLEGTLAYVSPEQTGRMNRVIDCRTDFYSLGVTLYEMLTGTLPFTGRNAMELVHSHVARPPVPPREKVPSLPSTVSAIVMKLMAKVAEDRYQSAYGLRVDLEQCLNELLGTGTVSDFLLAEHDYTDQLRIPQKLYGRKPEIEALLTAFTHAGQGAPELLMVSGPSGIGKSALVNEILRMIARRGGYFVAGKFEHLDRSTPYAAIIEAFRELLRQILTEPTESLEQWKKTLLAAIGGSGRLLADLIPELALVVGEQPSIPDLDTAESKNRFNMLMQSLLSAFCSVEHPVVMFLDDLQWADAVSLRLMEAMLTDPERGYLLVIGAYRENEVDATHPIRTTLEAVRQRGGSVTELTLQPLSYGDVAQLIADTLGCSTLTAAPLAEVVNAKTLGNPFFVNQFLLSLHAEELLRFDPELRAWKWDAARITGSAFTDNVIDFLVANLRRLDQGIQRLLQLAACIGHQFDLQTLATLHDASVAATTKVLWGALVRGLVVPVDPEYRLLQTADLSQQGSAPPSVLRASFRFPHDRVQQAAYSLLAETERRQAHLRLGRLMQQSRPPEQTGSDSGFFDLVNHLNLGAELITDPAERLDVARLNLSAAKYAKTAAAFVIAAEYFRSGVALLADSAWEQEYGLAFALNLGLAECEYLNGRSEAANDLFNQILLHAKSKYDRAAVYSQLVVIHNNASNFAEAIQYGFNGLALFGVVFPETRQEQMDAFKAELAEVATRLRQWPGDELLKAPPMSDPDQIAILKLLTSAIIPIYMAAPALFPLIGVKQVNICLQYGHVAASPYYYTAYGFILTAMLGQYKAGYQIGELGLALQEKLQDPAIGAKVDLAFSLYCYHSRPLREAVEYAERMHQPALEAGDLVNLASSCAVAPMMRFAMGEDLDSLLDKINKYLLVARRARNHISSNELSYFRQIVLNLMGRLTNRSSLNGATFDEEGFLREQEQSRNNLVLVWAYLLRLPLLFLYEDHAQALQIARKIEPLLMLAKAFYFSLEFPYYFALTLLALRESASADDHKEFDTIIDSSHAKLRVLAEHCPENFQRKVTLVAAERARVEGKDVEAALLYEQAIQQAGASDAVHDEALANNLCAKFHLHRGRNKLASAYMAEAYTLYQQWGAAAKCADMAERYAHLLVNEPARAAGTSTETGPPTGSVSLTTTRMIQQGLIDVETVLRAAEEISGAITLDTVLPQVMRVVIVNTGAQRGYLFLDQHGQLHVAAYTSAASDEIQVGSDVPAEAISQVPMSIVQYVARTREAVVTGDASRERRFLHDPYIAARQPKSVLCMALTRQNRLIGILYLENNRAIDAFTTYRVELLRLLTSQAGVAIENALLYTRVHEMTDELRVNNEQLEVQVAQRTEQLRETNERLLSRTAELHDANDRLVRELNERERTEQARAALQEEVIRMQRAMLEELSTPLIPITDRILVMPLIGSMDRERAQHILATVLHGAQRHRAAAVIIDITGMRQVDSGVASALINTAGALRLLGTHTVLTGIQAEVAQTLVGLGIDLSRLVIRSTLQSGIVHAMALTGASRLATQR